MLRLLLLRHAEAVARSGTDIERGLADTGRTGAARIGAYLRRSGLVPDLTLVSPARRARETFEIIEQELPQKPNHQLEPSIYNGTSSTLGALLFAIPQDIKTLMIVGHNPSVAELAITLAGDGDSAGLAGMRHHFPAPSLVVIDFDENDWAEAAAGHGRLDRFVTLATLPAD